MAGTRLLVQCYFVFVAFGLLIPWAMWQSLDRKNVVVVTPPAYVEFVVLNDFPLGKLSRSLEKIKPKLDELSLRAKTRIGRRDLITQDREEEFRFVVVYSNESRAYEIEGGGAFYTTSAEDVAKAALQYVQGKMRSDFDRHIQRARESLDMLRSISHLTRNFDERPVLALIDRAIEQKSSLLAIQARRDIQAALADPRLALPQHMSLEHVAAIYAPLIVPVLLPLLLSLKDEIKRYRRLTRIKLHLD